MDALRNKNIAKQAALLVCLLVILALFAPGLETAFAEGSRDDDALYEPEVVSVKDDSATPAQEGYTTYEKTSGNYKVLLCGVTDANKDSLADAVLANLSKGTPVKFVNSSFVDAEKYSTANDVYDMYHCWLGSTSNILTMTGWASRYVNPLTGANFSDEDDLFAFMSSSFGDAASLPDLAYSYFFDGMFGGTKNYYIRTSEATSIKPFAGTSHTGFDPQICSSSFVKRLELDSSLTNLNALEKLQSQAMEMSIEGGTSHSVTVVGAVIDESKKGWKRYPAILIADTDNEPSTSSTAPTSFEEACTAKKLKCNSYTLYHLGRSKNYDGAVAQVKNYLKRSTLTYIGSFTQVKYFSDDVRQAALETSSFATTNAKTTGDIAISLLDVYDQNYEDAVNCKLTDKLTVHAVVMSMNADVAFSKKTTGCKYLKNKIEVYRNGKLVGTIGKAARVNLAKGINASNGEHLQIDLSKFKFMHKQGNYTLKFYLNTGGIEETYAMNNNSPQSVSFTIGKGDNPLFAKASKAQVKHSASKVRKARVRVRHAKGKVTFKTAKSYAKVCINAKGRITFAKGCKKGTYEFAVAAAGNKNYLPATKTVRVKVK